MEAVERNKALQRQKGKYFFRDKTHTFVFHYHRPLVQTNRNQEPILQVLKSYLPTTPQSLSSTTVLEVASGTGQHAAFFASSFPHLTFQPSEAAEDAFESIIAWAQDHPNVALPPLLLDAAAPSASWPVPDATCIAVLCVNMTHISPFQATIGLLAGCGRVLTPQTGRLFLYGPFTIEGVPTTESNASFDAMLRARNPEWGLRDVGAVDEQAERVGLQREAMIEMPANNFILVYRRDC